eukprot:4105042-Pyramimonas_sp.AAC.1
MAQQPQTILCAGLCARVCVCVCVRVCPCAIKCVCVFVYFFGTATESRERTADRVGVGLGWVAQERALAADASVRWPFGGAACLANEGGVPPC